MATLTTSAFANENTSKSNHETESSVKLNTIIIEADQSNEVGKTVYSKEDLQKTPNSSKNITDFLKINPNVQFSNDHRAANSQAELKPAEISINGAQSFQNKFVINGVSNSNVLDPVGMGTSYTGKLNSGSQGVAINTDLLCKLEVLDSNVSAKHGNFTGGVIGADTCAPDSEIGKIHGSISYDYTESDWSSYHLKTEADKGLFKDEANQANQKEYTRQGISTNIYSKLSDVWGINLFSSHRESKLPVASGFEDHPIINQQKKNTNLGATAFYEPSEKIAAKFGFTLGDLEDNNYTESRRYSHNTVQNDSVLLFGEFSQNTDFAEFKHKLNFQNITNQRDWENNSGKIWLYAEGSKDWGNASKVMEGSLGSDLKLDQRSINYEFDATWNSFKFANSTHQINFGVGYRYDDVSWARPSDTTLFAATTHNNNPDNITLLDLKGQSCLANDPLCDEATTNAFPYKDKDYVYQGQYFVKGTLYRAGTFNRTYEQSFAYLEDTIKWNNFIARFGLRADYDSANNNLNFAPRHSLSYQPFDDNTLTFATGWNRYYSAPSYITDLQYEISNLKYVITRPDHLTEWNAKEDGDTSSTRKSDLKTPYADELVLGLNTQFKNTNLSLKSVNRQYKDEITRNRTDIPANDVYKYSYEYGNSGYGESDTYTFSANTISPINALGAKHHFGLAIDYNERFRGTPDYTTNLTEEDLSEWISYDG